MPRRARTNSPALAALAFALGAEPAAEVQLLPAGEFSARDGRPGNDLRWRIDDVTAPRVIERFAARRNPAVIDYEHQTLYASFKDGAAPAAGWFTGLRFDAAGLWATGVTWTERAAAMIAAGEYRFLSAVFSYLPESGEILEIHHAGLTNDPALDGLAEVWQHRAAARFTPLNPPEDTVDREQLIALLGLSADADDPQISAALSALKTRADQASALEQQVAALKAGATPDPAKYAPVTVVEELRTQLAALTSAQRDREVAELVDAGLQDGRLLPAQREWAEQLGRSDLAALRTYLDSAQPIAALRGTQTGGKAPAGGTGAHGLTAQQLAICTNCGLDPAEYAKSLGIEAAA